MPTPKIEIRRVSVEEILDLRHRILRAGCPPETARFDGDAAPDTWHWAAFPMDETGKLSARPAACLSLMFNSWQGEPAWQLRGMAVDSGFQRSGLGRQLLVHAETSAVALGKAKWFWCNARTPASGFYEAHGWTIASEVFEIPTAGPHVKMSKAIGAL